MSQDPGKDTRAVDVNGRLVVVKAPNDAQIMLLGQQGTLVMSERTAPADRMAAAGTLMNILSALIVQDDDREYVKEQIVAGKLDMAGMTEFIQAFRDKAKPVAVRRGRTPAR